MTLPRRVADVLSGHVAFELSRTHDGHSRDNRAAAGRERSVMSITVGKLAQKGARTDSLQEARAVVAGYTLGTKEIQGPCHQPVLRPRWGYRTYDCIPASEVTSMS
jgi:hypothetical protein